MRAVIFEGDVISDKARFDDRVWIENVFNPIIDLFITQGGEIRADVVACRTDLVTARAILREEFRAFGGSAGLGANILVSSNYLFTRGVRWSCEKRFCGVADLLVRAVKGDLLLSR
jgi:hypothetical protein